MQKSWTGLAWFLVFFGAFGCAVRVRGDQEIVLPEPAVQGDVSVEQAILQRRSVREFGPDPLTLTEISQLAWAAQGVTDHARGYRAAPSAGATFPIEIDFLITGSDDLDDGVYRYVVENHALVRRMTGDQRQPVHETSLRQDSILQAPVVMLVSGMLSRTEARYGERALRFMYMEAGHVAQNVYLQATALDIGMVVIGAFRDAELGQAIQLETGEQPLYVIPLGKSR